MISSHGGLPEGDYDLSIGIETGIPLFLPLSLGTQTGQDAITVPNTACQQEG